MLQQFHNCFRISVSITDPRKKIRMVKTNPKKVPRFQCPKYFFFTFYRYNDPTFYEKNFPLHNPFKNCFWERHSIWKNQKKIRNILRDDLFYLLFRYIKFIHIPVKTYNICLPKLRITLCQVSSRLPPESSSELQCPYLCQCRNFFNFNLIFLIYLS